MSEDLVKNFIKLFSMDWGNPESIEGFKKLLSKAKKAGDTSLASIVEARLASSKGNHEKALNLLEPLLSGDSPNPFALLMRARILCNDMEDYTSSLQGYTRIIDEPIDDIKTRNIIMFFAFFEKAALLGKLNRLEEEIALYDEVVNRFGREDGSALPVQVALAMYNKGVTLGKLKRHEEEIAIYDEVVNLFGQRGESVFLERVAIAMVNKSLILAQLNRHEEAISVCDAVVERFGKQEESAILEQVARALHTKGASLNEMKRFDEEISTYKEIVKLFGQQRKPAFLALVASAQVNLSTVFNQLSRHGDAISICDNIVSQYGDMTESDISQYVAMALVNKGLSLFDKGLTDDAIKTYDSVVECYKHIHEKEVAKEVARALVNKAVSLSKKESYHEAISACNEVFNRYGDREELILKEAVARAILSKTFCLFKVRKHDEIIQILRDIPIVFSNVEPETSGFWLDFFARVARQLVDITLGRPEEQDEAVIKWCLEKTKSDDPANLSVHLADVLKYIDKNKQNKFFKTMETARSNTDSFIEDESQFNQDLSFFLVLREWNSYTPALPAQEEADRGGGYFLRHGGEGIVIDPGYDFIDNFARAGGRLRDIQHIIVTHAHDDHTADLEALLMLFYRLRNPESSDVAMAREIPRDIRKNTQVSLYLSESVQRKFSGLLRLTDPMFRRNVTLSNPGKDENQILRLNEKATLTVLPAYHDDVISREHAVGLCLDCDIDNGRVRRIVFTGDSGLYPRLSKVQGSADQGEPEVDDSEGKALFERYKAILGERKPDLLVAHIGSIKKQEFPSEHFTYAELERHFKPSRRFYVNHLGLLGTLLLIYKLAPKAVVISEFGSELKDIRIELVNCLAQALHDRQEADDPTTDKTFVTPGDLTIFYNIETHQFLCHSNCRFKDCSALKVEPACNYSRQLDSTTGKYDSVSKEDYKRAYLFPASSKRTEAEHNDYAKKFFEKLFNCKLPIHKKK